MTIRYDEKGKFFTDVVSKDPVPVIAQTLLHRIEGNVFLREDERLKDALNRDPQFVAMSSVTVSSLQGQKIYRSDFLLVNKEHIIWIIESKDREIEE